MQTRCTCCNCVILSHNRVLVCLTCSRSFHVNCLPYWSLNENKKFHSDLCHLCLVENFPFNHIDDNDQFKSATSTAVMPQYSVFSPLNFENDDHAVTEVIENDPDLQFYNNFRCMQNVQNCIYYSGSSFNQMYQNRNISNCCLSLIHFNIRSIARNLSAADIFLSSLNVKFTIIALTETWLSPSSAYCYSMPGYNMESKCRTNKVGGGVAILIQCGLNYQIRNDLAIFCEILESIIIEIPKSEISTTSNVIIGVIYRPPGGNIEKFNELFSGIIEKLKKEKKLIYLLGDFNLNLLNAESHQLTSIFLDILYAASFFPLINRPTRITNGSATLIDNVLCNDIVNSTHHNGIICTDISDHYPVFSLNCGTDIIKKPSFIETRKFNDVTRNTFKDKLSSTDWSDILNCEDPQEAFTRFYTVFTNMYNATFPIERKRIGHKNRNKWVTSGLKNSIKAKNKLYFTQKKYPTEYNIRKYKIYKAHVKRLLKKCERDYYTSQLEKYKSNMRKSWGVIKDIINRNKSHQISSKFLINGTLVEDPKVIANNFNRFYINIGPTTSKNCPVTDIRPYSFIENEVNQSIYLEKTTNKELVKIIGDLKNSSHGPDDIRTDVFKETFDLYITPLVHVINLSLAKGYFPNELKIARVMPIFKSGDPLEIKNYRPISVLNVFSKLFEKVMYDRTIDFLNKNNILYNLQFGFRKGYNTANALVYLVDKIITSLENGENIIGTFIDLSKAFDCVNHDILLGKLYRYGIRGQAHRWFSSYLQNRSQFVLFHNSESDKASILCGVPQGSILGPLLFLVYINDLQYVSKLVTPIMYADDTNLFLSGSDLRNLTATLNNELSKYMTWMSCNKLSVNITKTNYMIFRRTRQKLPEQIVKLYINGTEIDKVSSAKFLGVILDETMSWLPHISHIKSKIAKGIGVICKARKYLNLKALKSIYYSFVYPHLIYCIEVWGCACKTYLTPIIKIQRKAIRLIHSLPFSQDPEPIFKQSEILPFQQLLYFSTTLFIFKYRKGLLPGIFHTLYDFPNHDYDTRGQSLMIIPPCRSTMAQRCIRYTGVKVGNKLNTKIEWKCSFHSFKRNLKKYLLTNPILKV